MSDVSVGNVETFVRTYLEVLLRELRDSKLAKQNASVQNRHYKQARVDNSVRAERADAGDVDAVRFLMSVANTLAREEWAINNASRHIRQMLMERPEDPAWELVVYLARHEKDWVEIPSRWMPMWNMAKAQALEERAQEEARKKASVTYVGFEERFKEFLVELGFVQNFDQ